MSISAQIMARLGQILSGICSHLATVVGGYRSERPTPGQALNSASHWLIIETHVGKIRQRHLAVIVALFEQTTFVPPNGEGSSCTGCCTVLSGHVTINSLSGYGALWAAVRGSEAL